MNATATQTRIYDVEAIRADFPILSRLVHGKPLIYLDNGASAQKPQSVIDAVTRVYSSEYSNVHRGLHFLSNLATEHYEAARETVRAFLAAPEAEEIIFTRSSTEAINLVAQSLPTGMIKAGDEIVLSVAEHHSNIVPWHFWRERTGAVLKWVDVDDEGCFSIEAFAAALGPRTKFVAITHMSNVLGTLLPVKEICALAHERNIPVLVDGSQAAVHLPVNVADLGCDFYSFTGHKLYGPSGIGVLWGKREWLERLRPFLGGGEMIESVTRNAVSYNQIPHRFEAGTPPITQAIGLGAAIEYVNQIGMSEIAAHEAQLCAAAHEQLARIGGVRIFGNAPGKGAIISFELDGIHAHDVSMVLDRAGIAVRAGTHCAQPLLERFGVTSTCRASFGLYNTLEEVSAVADALYKTKEFFA